MKNGRGSLGVLGWGWRVAAMALVTLAGTVIGGGVVTALRLPWPQPPVATDAGGQLLLTALGALLVALCVAPLAHRLRGTPLVRALALAAFTYVCWGLNNQLEAALFTTFGGLPAMAVMFVGPALCCGAAAALLIPVAGTHPGTAEAGAVLARPLATWWWRAALVWLAFPVIYHAFGMLIYPLVRDVYEAAGSALVVPEAGVVIQLVLVRSLLYLIVTLPLVSRWTGSRPALGVALATAFFVMVGLTGLLGATWWPVHMRLVHMAEILADSLVYAWVIVALLAPRQHPGQSVPSAAL